MISLKAFMKKHHALQWCFFLLSKKRHDIFENSGNYVSSAAITSSNHFFLLPFSKIQ